MSNLNDHLLALSNDAMEDAQPSQYTSAIHALSSYLHICDALTSTPAVDYERLSVGVQVCPTAEPIAFERISAKRELERVLDATAARVGAKRWRHWLMVRVQHVKYPDGMSMEYARDVQRFVDGVFEEELANQGILARPRPRPPVNDAATNQRAA